MILKYKKKNLYIHLVLGIVWIIFGFVMMATNDDEIAGKDLGYFAFGIVYFGLYIFNYTQHYIVVKDGIIKEPGLFGTKLKIDEITSFRKFAGDYIVVAKDKKLHINTELIDPYSLQELLEFIETLELKKGK